MGSKSKHVAEIEVTANTSKADRAIDATLARLQRVEKRAEKLADSSGASRGTAKSAVNRTIREREAELKAEKKYESDFNALLRADRKEKEKQYEADFKSLERSEKREAALKEDRARKVRKARLKGWDSSWKDKEKATLLAARKEKALVTRVERSRATTDKALRRKRAAEFNSVVKEQDAKDRSRNARRSAADAGLRQGRLDARNNVVREWGERDARLATAGQNRRIGGGRVLGGLGMMGGGIVGGTVMAASGNPSGMVAGMGVAAGGAIAGIGKIIGGISQMMQKAGKVASGIPGAETIGRAMGFGAAAAGAIGSAAIGERSKILGAAQQRERGETLLGRYGAGSLFGGSGVGFYNRSAEQFALSPAAALAQGVAFGGGAGMGGALRGEAEFNMGNLRTQLGVGSAQSGAMVGAIGRRGSAGRGRLGGGANLQKLTSFMLGNNLMGGGAAGAVGGYFDSMASRGLGVDENRFWDSVGGISKNARHNTGRGVGAMRIHAKAGAVGLGQGGLRGMMGGALDSILMAQSISQSKSGLPGAIRLREKWASDPQAMLGAARKGGANKFMLRMGMAGAMSQEEMDDLFSGSGGAYGEELGPVPGMMKSKGKAISDVDRLSKGAGGAADAQFMQLVAIGSQIQKTLASLASPGGKIMQALNVLSRAAAMAEQN